jgi:hypothetical protein
MKQIAKNRITKRLALLIVLVLTLVYLRSPTKAHATTCLQECYILYEDCLDYGSCRSHPLCVEACSNGLTACEANCY